MSEKEISSVHHSLVKKVVALRLDSKARKEEGLVLITGEKLIRDISLRVHLETLFFSEKRPPFAAKETIKVSKEVFKKMTSFEASEGIAALVLLPKPMSLVEKKQILVLDQIQDPGNLGTLWRCAFALGWEGIWLTKGCVDPFNEKALRAAQSASFLLSYEITTPEKILTWAKEKDALLVTADLTGVCPKKVVVKHPFALILGNEGKGPGSWTKGTTQSVSIPMDPRMESLNVASAGAILLYLFQGKK